MHRAFAVAATVAICAACTQPPGGAAKTVVAGFYPLAEVARRVGGSSIRVVDLTPAGAEPHDLELTTRQADQILDADLVVLLGRGFQPAPERLAAQRKAHTIELLETLPISKTGPVPAQGGGLDPHVWLDPELMQSIVGAVQSEITKIDQTGAAATARRADAYLLELRTLTERYRSGLSSCKRHVIVTAHAAFGYLARRFGLEEHAIAAFSPEAEPSPARLAALADVVKREGVTTIFTEGLVSPKVAEALAREAGVNTAMLNPIEGLTSGEIAAGDTYITVMKRNLDALRAALDCA